MSSDSKTWHLTDKFSVCYTRNKHDKQNALFRGRRGALNDNCSKKQMIWMLSWVRTSADGAKSTGCSSSITVGHSFMSGLSKYIFKSQQVSTHHKTFQRLKISVGAPQSHYHAEQSAAIWRKNLHLSMKTRTKSAAASTEEVSRTLSRSWWTAGDRSKAKHIQHQRPSLNRPRSYTGAHCQMSILWHSVTFRPALLTGQDHRMLLCSKFVSLKLLGQF